MRENTTPDYLAAFDAARDAYQSARYRSEFEAMSWGFDAGVRYGREHPASEPAG